VQNNRAGRKIKMKKLILASNSPRRRELLEQIGVEFEVIPSNAEEKVTKQEPSEVVEELSRQKAEDVAAAVEDGIVLGADTVVCQDGQIMGKPKDEADAKQMLQKLQGEEHSVYTGVTILVKENGAVQHVQTFSQETKVYVYEMTDEEIDRYIATGEPMDKAGAYGIQGRFAAYVDGIEGDYNNVVGLPVSAVWQELKELL
jgi:septum formation protein